MLGLALGSPALRSALAVGAGVVVFLICLEVRDRRLERGARAEVINAIQEVNREFRSDAIAAGDAHARCLDAGGRWLFLEGRCAG